MLETSYIYQFDIAALCIAAIVYLEFAIKKTLPSRQSRAFLLIHTFTTLAAFFDFASTFALVKADVLPIWFNELMLILFYTFFHGLGAVYLHYIILTTKKGEERLKTSEKLLVLVPFGIDFVMIITNPFLHLMGTFDKVTRTYSSVGHIGMYYAYFQVVAYVIISLVFVFRQRKVMLKKHKFIVAFYTVVVLTCVIIQMFFPNLLISTFGTELSALVVAFTLENPNYFEDQTLGIYNRLAFETVINKKISDGKQFSIIGVKVEGLTDLREIVGMNSIGNLLRNISKFFLSIGEKDSVFSVAEAQFAFIVYGGDSEVEMYIKKVQHRFETPFEVEDESVRLTAVMSRFQFPGDVKTSEGVMDLLEYSLISAEDIGRETVLVADAKLLEERKRASQVLQVMRTALAENRFAVYYQPIYSVEDDGFKSAEALLRLYDDELGFIPPDEFIPIAEKNGLIMKLGEYVFRETCRFMSENRIWKMGIEYIDVNLSPIQCMQANLHERLVQIMDEYRLEYSRISIEITETMGLMRAKSFRENMTALINKGVRFSLDDYGTGYSNLSTVVDYPFSIVKLDKSMLWSAMKNDKAMTVLRQTIRMMKQLSLELIAEGVETEEQAQLLAYYGCDFFQGFFYAKPQPGEQFLKLLESNKPAPKII